MQNSLVFYWNNLDEIFNIAIPVIEHGTSKFTACVEIMLTDKFVQFLAITTFLNQVYLNHIHVTEIVEIVVLVPHVGNTTTHSGSEISTRFTKHYNTTACHIFATMVASTLDNSNSTRVAHTEALAHLTIDIQFAACSSIKTSVTSNDIVLGIEVASYWRENRNTTSRESLSKIVISLAFEFKINTLNKECAKTLTSRPLELNSYRSI